MLADATAQKKDKTYALAARLFHVMSAPIRLKIIRYLSESEKNVSQLLDEVQTTQPNISQHLNTLFQAGILSKRRVGTQIFYKLMDQRIVTICEAIYGHPMLCHSFAYLE